MFNEHVKFRKTKCSKNLKDWNEFKIYHNLAQEEIRFSKVRHYYNAFNDQKSALEIWQIIKTLGVNKPQS